MSRSASVQLDPDSVLYVDNDVIAVDKASGVLCDATRDPNREHLGTALVRWAKEHAPEETPHDFFPAHRLDLGTSGVVLFARTRSAASDLMKQFQDRTVAKRYQAVALQPEITPWNIGDTFDRRSYLRHHKGMSEEVRSGGKPSETSFEILDVAESLALVRCMPTTGRTHQLRVHLAAIGAPIVGDDRYGQERLTARPDLPSSRLWLHAYELEIDHPTTGDRLVLQSRHRLSLQDGGPTESNTTA